MTLTRADLLHAIGTTLADHCGDFNVPGIADAITQEYGAVTSLDDVPTEDYWEIVKAYDRTDIL